MDKLQIDYRAAGFCLAEGLLDAGLLVEIEHNLGAFMRDVAPHLGKPHINYTNDQVNSIHCLCIKDGLVELPDSVQDFITSDNFFWSLSQLPRVRELVSHLLNDEPEFRRAELFAKPPRDGLPSPYHQDNYYWAVADANALTVWMALNDCGKDNGALTYYPASHEHGLIRHVDSNAPGSSQMIPEEELAKLRKPVAPVLRQGDGLFHHSLTVHGSRPNQSNRPRRGLTMQFKGVRSKYDMSLHHHYMGRLKKQIKDN